MEEVDYSEEAKYDLFESVAKEKLDWAECLISKMAPSFEQILNKLEEKDIKITKKQYEKICKKLFKSF
jgi:hypothetical protein